MVVARSPARSDIHRAATVVARSRARDRVFNSLRASAASKNIFEIFLKSLDTFFLK
jgi:hypothetical protein